MNPHNLLSCIFFILGVISYLPGLLVFVIGNEDILAGSTLATSVVLFVSSTDVIGKIVSPSIVSRLTLIASMLVYSFLSGGSLLWIVLVQDISLRIVGIGMYGYCYGMGPILFLRQSANYDNCGTLCRAYIAGTNLATLLASLAYTGNTIPL